MDPMHANAMLNTLDRIAHDLERIANTCETFTNALGAFASSMATNPAPRTAVTDALDAFAQALDES